MLNPVPLLVDAVTVRVTGISVGAIEKLIEGGQITKGFGAALHHVRQLGNVGAHASDERIDESAVERAFRFTTQVLRNLFEIPAELAAISGQGDAAEPVAKV